MSGRHEGLSWWRHQKKPYSALLAICAGNTPVPGEFPAQRPVTRSFDVFFDLRLNKRLRRQSRGWWFETPSRPLWRHCNDGLVLVWTEVILTASLPTVPTVHLWVSKISTNESRCNVLSLVVVQFCTELMDRKPTLLIFRYRRPVNSFHKGQWRESLMFSLICASTNGWVNNRDAGDLGRHRARYDVTIMAHW